MAPVEGHDQIRVEPIREDHDRGVDSPQWEVAVPFHELGNDRPVVGERSFNAEVPQAPDERGFDARPETISREVADLGDDEAGDDEVQIPTLQHPGTASMVRIPPVDRGEQRARVNDRG